MPPWQITTYFHQELQQNTVESKGYIANFASSASAEEEVLRRKESSRVYCRSSSYNNQVRRRPTSEYWCNQWLQRGSLFCHRKICGCRFHIDVITDHLHRQIYTPPTFIFLFWGKIVKYMHRQYFQPHHILFRLCSQSTQKHILTHVWHTIAGSPQRMNFSLVRY